VWAQTGTCAGEVAALRWADLDKGTVTVQRTYSRGRIGPTKTRQSRAVSLLHPVPEETTAWKPGATVESRAVLLSLRRLPVQAIDPEAYVFVWQGGKALTPDGSPPRLEARPTGGWRPLSLSRAAPAHLRQHDAQPECSPALRPAARRLEVSRGTPPGLCPMDAAGVRGGRERIRTPGCTSPTPNPRCCGLPMTRELPKCMTYLITQNPCASTPSGTLNLLRKFSSATAAVSSTSCGSVK
jgi:hypothetical protein